MNELARNILFKRQFLRIWSQKTLHNYIRVLVRRALLAGEKLLNIISVCAAAEGLFPLPEGKLGIQYILTNCYCSNVIICTVAVMKPGCKKWKNAYAYNWFMACSSSFPRVNSNKQK